MRWLVMQSMKHKKWVLAVIQEATGEYEVTDVMSERVDKIVRYAEYLNEGRKEACTHEKVARGTKNPWEISDVSGKAVPGLDAGELYTLERLKQRYEARENCQENAE